MGTLYFYYYISTNDMTVVKKLSKSQKVGYYGIVFIMPVLFAPIAFVSLVKIIIKNGGKIK